MPAEDLPEDLSEDFPEGLPEDLPEDLPERLRPLIEKYRGEAEATGRLPDPLLDGLRAAGVFRLTTPRELGGCELPLVRVLKLLEGLGRVDGPTAWVAWNLNLGLSAAFLGERGVARIWSRTPDPLIANSAQPGLLTETPDGYLLSGEWKAVSGADAADWIALVGLVHLVGSTGQPPEVRICWVPRAEVTVQDTCQVAGMRGTGGSTVVARAVIVPRELTVPFGAAPRIDRPLYRLPLIHLIFPGCAAVLLGMARAAVDELASLARTRSALDGEPLSQQPRTQATLGRATVQLGAARAYLFATADALESASAEGRTSADAESERGELRGAISHAAEVARTVISATYEAASSTALCEPTRLAGLLRDGHAAARHANMSAAHYELADCAMLGGSPGALFV